MQRSVLACLTLATVVAGCATPAYVPHYPDVRPAADGTHRAILLSDRKDGHYQEAFRQARDFCGDVHQKRPVVSGEGSRYVGTMPESTYNTLKAVSQVALAGGAAVGAVGRNSGTRAAGAGVATAGAIGAGTLEPGYEYSLAFRCE